MRYQRQANPVIPNIDVRMMSRIVRHCGYLIHKRDSLTKPRERPLTGNRAINDLPIAVLIQKQPQLFDAQKIHPPILARPGTFALCSLHTLLLRGKYALILNDAKDRALQVSGLTG